MNRVHYIIFHYARDNIHTVHSKGGGGVSLSYNLVSMFFEILDSFHCILYIEKLVKLLLFHFPANNECLVTRNKCICIKSFFICEIYKIH